MDMIYFWSDAAMEAPCACMLARLHLTVSILLCAILFGQGSLGPARKGPELSCSSHLGLLRSACIQRISGIDNARTWPNRSLTGPFSTSSP